MKPFKTVEEQLNLLKNRKINFDNDEEAKKYLLRNNYYLVINCYSKFFLKDNNSYLDGTNFKEIINVHIFDKEIRNSMLKCILEIEKHFRAIVSHVFSDYHREPYAYLIASNYKKEDILNVSQTISKLSQTLKKYINDNENNSIKHYHKVHKDVPLWVLCNYIDFGSIITIYKHMNDSEKNTVAKEYSKILCENLGDYTIKITSKELLTIIYNISEVRNKLAHSNRIIYFNCKNNFPYIKELHQLFNISDYSPKQNIYNTFIIMYALIEKQTYAIMHNSILKRASNLRNKLITIDSNLILESLGFPENWDKNTKKIPQK